MSNELFVKIHTALQGKLNRRGFYDANCVWCGKEAKPGQNHFGYYYDERTGTGFGKCFVCGNRGSLAEIAKQLHLDSGGYSPIHRVSEPRLEPTPIAAWRKNPDHLLAMCQAHPDRYAAWNSYKPLDPTTIDRFNFGYGSLPFLNAQGHWYMSKNKWLIVPLYERGELVGLRGRSTNPNSKLRWCSATGSTYTLWGAEFVRPGAVTWLCENYVDAAWLMQEHPDWCAVAIGGATTWQAEWAEKLAARQPEMVIVALDNDLPGQATSVLRRKLERAWVQQRGTEPPPANGPKIANALRRVGVNAVLFKWPESAPVKAGLDWVLEQRAREVA